MSVPSGPEHIDKILAETWRGLLDLRALAARDLDMVYAHLRVAQERADGACANVEAFRDRFPALAAELGDEAGAPA